MKIGVNARFLTKPHTGIGQHTKYLFLTLAKRYPETRFILVVPKKITDQFPNNVEIHVLAENFPGTSGMRKTYWEQWQVPRFLISENVDILHFPYPCNPWRPVKKPVMVTVHDTIPWTLNSYRSSLSTRLYQDRCYLALRLANHIFTVSKATKEEIFLMCNDVLKEKISVTYNAPASYFHHHFTKKAKELILKKYGLDPLRQYFFYVGGYDKRKNVDILVDVFLKNIASRYNVDLVLAGNKAASGSLYSVFDDLTHLNKENRLKVSKGKVILTGFVAESDLPALYQSSLAFVNISSKEGCNLPLLEAAMSSVPVVTSDIPVHREMIGEIGIFCYPYSKNQLASLLVRLIIDKKFYQIQKQKFTHYRCPFSWQDTADEVMRVYRHFI